MAAACGARLPVRQSGHNTVAYKPALRCVEAVAVVGFARCPFGCSSAVERLLAY